MITYDSTANITNLARVRGSVFPQALKISLPCALFTSTLTYVIFEKGWVIQLRDPDSVMNNNAVWGGFNFLVGFLVVFRTSQAYSRFWEGATSTHKMGAEWFDSCSSLMAFCKHTPSRHYVQVLEFQNTLIRLFSMLHAAALGEIEDCGDDAENEEIEAFKMELIDAEGIDLNSLKAVRDSDAKVELIFQWIQQLVVEALKRGYLTIPPPILSRSFQEIANGMVHFHDAIKISNVPFPFPYAQTCDALLMFHWLLTPFVVSQWVTKAWWAVNFSFIQVFTLWTLNLIAVELENPFGTDPNDIDGPQMQKEMNNHLRLLLCDEARNTPQLKKRRKPREQPVETEEYNTLKTVTVDAFRNCKSFSDIWAEMVEEDDEIIVATRRSADTSLRVSVPMSASSATSVTQTRGHGGSVLKGTGTSTPRRKRVTNIEVPEKERTRRKSGASRSSLQAGFFQSAFGSSATLDNRHGSSSSLGDDDFTSVRNSVESAQTLSMEKQHARENGVQLLERFDTAGFATSSYATGSYGGGNHAAPTGNSPEAQARVMVQETFFQEETDRSYKEVEHRLGQIFEQVPDNLDHLVEEIQRPQLDDVHFRPLQNVQTRPVFRPEDRVGANDSQPTLDDTNGGRALLAETTDRTTASSAVSMVNSGVSVNSGPAGTSMFSPQILGAPNMKVVGLSRNDSGHVDKSRSTHSPRQRARGNGAPSQWSYLRDREPTSGSTSAEWL